MEFITYRSSSPAGDCISFLAGIKKMWEDTGKKGIFYQRLGMQGVGYPDSIHPFLNGEDEPICMNKYMFDMLSPLICSQEYIEDFRVYDGEKVDFDFDLIRQERFTNQPRGVLNRWFNYVFPQMASDISLPWIKLYSTEKNNKVIINFTQRYRSPLINYHFLREHQKDILFAGLQKERDLFCEQWGLDIPLLVVNDFFELGKYINGCRLFMGNASVCYQIAEALKVPRILETFPMMPNVVPMGKDGYDFYAQSAVEYYFNKLLNK